MLINSIKLNNFLSFGETSPAVSLRPLNVIIGANGSGKSNLLEAIELLRNAPNELTKPIREGGGVTEWLWKGTKEKNPVASIDVIFDEFANHPEVSHLFLHYGLSFSVNAQRFILIDEKINRDDQVYYNFNNGKPLIKTLNGEKTLQKDDIDFEKSILAQIRDPYQYTMITHAAKKFSKIKLYREWSFGCRSSVRVPEKADLPNDILETDTSNLGLVLHRLSMDPKTKQRILDALRSLINGIDDFGVNIESGTVQVFIREGSYIIPATRLSDGTLRYLCLLVILCYPNPPPLVCIEEPELGLYPDILPTLADLLKEASTRCQLIVTTHSDILVDTMTDQPESVLVCEKGEAGTALRRLSAEELKPWLEKYRLGELWMSGQLGGTRW